MRVACCLACVLPPTPHPRVSHTPVARCACVSYTRPLGLAFNATAFPSLPWAHESRGVVHALQGHRWGNWLFQVDTIDASAPGVVNVSWSRGGFQEARGAPIGAEYYVENYLELLDSPLEWCVPRIHGGDLGRPTLCCDTLVRG